MATTGSLTCPRDGTATQLTCVECGTPICPSCMVRTPVGLICPDDVTEPVQSHRGEGPRLPAAAVFVAVGLIATAVIVGVRALGFSDRAPEPVAEPVTRAGLEDEVRVGTYAVRLTRFECGARQLGEPPTVRTAEGRFCVAHLSIRKAEPGSDLFTGAEQVLSDGTGRFAPDLQRVPGAPPATIQLHGSREIFSLRLDPGIVFRGMLVYDVPETSTPTELLFHDRPSNLVARIRLPS